MVIAFKILILLFLDWYCWIKTQFDGILKKDKMHIRKYNTEIYLYVARETTSLHFIFVIKSVCV